MILVICLNPAIDVRYTLDDFQKNSVNRLNSVKKTAGGKGLNVSKVLDLLQEDVTLTGFLGGSNGEFIQNFLDTTKIKSHFIKIKGETRSCLAVDDDKTMTEILEPGPTITEDEKKMLLDYLHEVKDDYDIVSLSGSLPKGLDKEYFDEILKIFEEKKLIIDVSSPLLEHVALNDKINLFAIKPNEHEVKSIIDGNIETILFDQKFSHIELLIVSLGKDGSIARYKDKLYKITVPVIKAVNPVGSGDSSIAGLIYGISQNKSIEDSLKYSMTMGVLNAMEETTGYVNVEKIEEIYNKINIEVIK